MGGVVRGELLLPPAGVGATWYQILRISDCVAGAGGSVDDTGVVLWYLHYRPDSSPQSSAWNQTIRFV